jgi:enoyl-CoA hydratase/carnithine racemase
MMMISKFNSDLPYHQKNPTFLLFPFWLSSFNDAKSSFISFFSYTKSSFISSFQQIMVMEHLLIEKKRNVVTVTFNRPEKMNAITLEMMKSLRDVLVELQNDTKTTILVFRAAGDKAFSAGVDSKEILTLPPEKKAEVYDIMVETAMLALNCDKILIAALNGVMLGMGAALALGADLRVAANRPEVYLQCLEVDVGMFPFFVMGLGFYHFPPSVAAKLVFGAEKFELPEMQHYGFIHSVYEPEEFEKGIAKIVRYYSNKRPEMIRISKQCLIQERKLLLDQMEIEHKFADKFYKQSNGN